MTVESFSFTTLQQAFPLPVITHNPAKKATLGQEMTLSATVVHSGTKTVTLYYRLGGRSSFNSITMTELGNNLYEGTIPSEAITENGLEYYLAVTDELNRLTTHPATTPTINPYTIIVYIPTLANPYFTPAKSYRMLSVPFDLDVKSPAAVLTNNLGVYNKTEWRLFRYQGTQNMEYTMGIQDFSPGRGFWLITKSVKAIDAGPGYSITSDQNFVIELQSGWNMIGNPFAFTVNWSEVIKTGTVEAPVTYTGAGNDTEGFVYNRTQLVPWKGYIVIFY
jgi:hypothetical protein